MKEKFRNQDGGFLKTIVLIIVALIVLKYFNISLSDAINWLKELWDSIFN